MEEGAIEKGSDLTPSQNDTEKGGNVFKIERSLESGGEGKYLGKKGGGEREGCCKGRFRYKTKVNSKGEGL